MAITERQNNLIVNQDWTKIYQSFRNADFQSYDFQTLRKTMIDYIKIYYPENFNDYIESSEYIALIDLIAFLGQSLAFRTDLNARENFIDTAERRDSVLKLARLISYNSSRNVAASGYLKFESVQTTQSLRDNVGNDITNSIITWNDSTNPDWYEQFVIVLNSALVSSQSVGSPTGSKIIDGVSVSEYNLNSVQGQLPILPFSVQIDNTSLSFEIVSPTIANKDYVYESSPLPGKPLNILYKNDNLGNASNNTGFFLYFKQGTLSNTSFSFPESIPNNLANVNVSNINNDDVWLYELNSIGQAIALWEQIPSVNGTNIIYNNNAARKSYQVNTRANDQIDLVFGDGTYAQIPVGTFRTYYRTSVGLSYKITPDEMSNVTFSIPYVSRLGRLETLTVVASLKYTVANALPRESLAEIKSKAPQLYYTQNRMITGEDYNIFPYANYSSISKVKAVNRTSSGISRYLDISDTTGRYSSTNIFAQDGIFYKEDGASSFSFTFNTTSDINRVIQNQVLEYIRGKSLLHFYYYYFKRFPITSLYWNKVTTGAGSSSGYFKSSTSSTTPVSVGVGQVDNKQYITEGSILIVSPGSGKYFNSANEIVSLPSSGKVPQNGKTLLYVSVSNLVGNASQNVLSSGQGPVQLSVNLASNSQIIAIIPAFSNQFTTAFISQLIGLISNYNNFGIRYDQNIRTWRIINAQDVDSTSSFSQKFQGDITGQNLDASWVLNFTVENLIYTVSIRGLNYIFESTEETKFYFDSQNKTYDPVTGNTVNDSVKVLKVNGNASTGEPLTNDIILNVYNQIPESDGYIDTSKVLVTYSDDNANEIPDNPDVFNSAVQPIIYNYATSSEINSLINTFEVGQLFYASTDESYYEIVLSSGSKILNAITYPGDKLIYFVKTFSYNNFITYEPVESGVINDEFSTQNLILQNVNNYVTGQIFYAYDEQTFYQIVLENNVRTLTVTEDYLARIGRNDLYFQYRHNAPGNRRIDPSPSNLIDMYILTKEYETSYRSWILDNTGTVTEPEEPTATQLKISFSDIEEFKSVSDSIIYNSAKFKPLFGIKAQSELRATFKVIKNQNINLSDTEIKSRVISFINVFFSSGNWDFGETFYFTELATFIQQSMAPNISSIVIVPNSSSQVYGSLQQITSAPNEILISCATVEDVQIISSITASQLNLQTLTMNTLI
jgi:hypothetical protein